MYLLNKSLANASNEALRKSYHAICEEYRRRFCEKFGYSNSECLTEKSVAYSMHVVNYSICVELLINLTLKKNEKDS